MRSLASASSQASLEAAVSLAQIESELPLAAAWNCEYREHGLQLLTVIHKYVSQQTAPLAPEARSLLQEIEEYLTSLPAEEPMPSSLVAPQRVHPILLNEVIPPFAAYRYSQQALGWVAHPLYVQYKDRRCR